MSKKRKWEKDFESADLTAIETRISELDGKYENQTMTREELAEHKKLKAIKENLPKVKNVLELRDVLNGQKEEIKNEISERKNLVEMNEESQILEDEMRALEEEHNELESQMKDPNLTKEQRTELESKIKDNENKRQENNVKFGKLQEELSSRQSKENKFENMTIEDLENKSLQISSEISKCNFACNRLMQGYSWDSVEVALDNFKSREFRATGENADRMQRNRAAARKENHRTLEDTIIQAFEDFDEEVGVEPDVVEVEEEIETDSNETALVEANDKPSRFSKIAAFLKAIPGKIKQGVQSLFKKKESNLDENYIDDDEYNPIYEDVLLEPDEVEVEEEVGTVENNSHDNDFKRYLREVAEKGLSGIEEENRQATATNELDKKIELYENRYNELLGREDADKTTLEKLATQIEELKAQRDGDERE